MRWRLNLEEHNPELVFMNGSKNIAADSLSRLDTNNPIQPNISPLAEHLLLEKENVLHPLNYKTILQYKQHDIYIIETTK